MGAGKSSFINSIEFAYKGERSQPTRSTGDITGGDTMPRSCLHLTPNIHLFDNRGMKDFDLSYVDRFMNEISDKKEEEGSSDATRRLLDEEIIDCAVFVYKHSDSIKKEAAVKFLSEFATKLQENTGYPPMLVITHADSLSTEDKRDLKESFTTHCDEVWFFENCTKSIEKKKKSVEFLKFLKTALHRCDASRRDVAIVNIERQKKNRKPPKSVF
ncbi:uncharacterized protein LOC576240 [Strongylocentrotus purpuratus]|uniref:G domain-containing protein n=1 Tax=Strongylocentrotus purpuratus TaxID=7668 RepID=A0A7M7NXU7_STRPU|nr:uncharacterized protein LOC576240 [Strongylocentrotus purpuratus]